MGKLQFKLDTDEDRKHVYDFLDSFSSKKDIFKYFDVSDNTANVKKLNDTATLVGFDFSVYKERRNPSKFCIECGKKLKKGQKKFCSSSCAAKHNNLGREVSEEHRKKTSDSLKHFSKENPREKVLYRYVCESCGEVFFTRRKIKEDRLIRCQKCKRKAGIKNIEDIESILELPKTTAIKILKRAGCGCAICGWDESTCDIHHIIPKKNGGGDEHKNLIVVCPNHHRILHTKENVYSYDFLRNLSIEKNYPNWKEFYYKQLREKIE